MADMVDPAPAQPASEMSSAVEQANEAVATVDANDTILDTIVVKQEPLSDEHFTPSKAATAMALFDLSNEFPWDSWIADPHVRVAMKQHAVDVGLQLASEICDLLRDNTKPEACGKEIVEWMKDIGKLAEDHKNFKVLIGVAGKTGAGKSTILNTLLEIPELLPSSNSEASTACVCLVSWNPDDTPGRKLRAVVCFRSVEDVKSELDDIFARVRKREEGKVVETETEDSDAVLNRVDEDAEEQRAIAEGFKKIKAVWGLEEDAALSMSSQQILDYKPEVLELLGTTKEIYSDDPDTFSEQVKPYMDSSENLQKFRAWPLITEVRLFLKNPLLQHGVTLVDLPGLSDSVESRAQVAEKFSQQLNIVVIATPARRAIDEKTGVDLMSDHQTWRAQMDGKFHRKAFCVVVSQADEIDCDTFLKGNPKAAKNDEIQKTLKAIQALTQQGIREGIDLKRETAELQKREKELEKLKKKLDTEFNPTGPGSRAKKKQPSFISKREKVKADKSRKARDKGQQLRNVNQLKQRKALTEQRLAAARARLKWTCMSMRNEHIEKAIKKDFARRQKALLRDGRKNPKQYDGSVDIIPVSATAYRDLLKGRKAAGFPTKNHTGIPRLRQWLVDSTVEQREEHLDTMLNALRRLLNSGIQWLMKNSSDLALEFPRQAVEDAISKSHAQFLGKLGEELRYHSKNIVDLDPFKEIQEGNVIAFRKLACKAAARFAVKHPEDEASSALMHWSTFNAITQRNGGPFFSNSREKREYDLPRIMSLALLTPIQTSWHDAFHICIPQAEKPIMKAIDKVWEAYAEELKTQVNATAPNIMPDFEKAIQAIRDARMEFRDQIKAALRKLSQAGATIHPEFLQSLRSDLVPIFQDSLHIIGPGHFQKRRKFLVHRVKEDFEIFFMTGHRKMVEKHRKNVYMLPVTFSDIVTFVGSRIMSQIVLLLDELSGTSGKDWVVEGMEPWLEQQLLEKLTAWHHHWSTPQLAPDAVMRENVDIPTEYGVEEEEVPETKNGRKKPRAKVKNENDDEDMVMMDAEADSDNDVDDDSGDDSDLMDTSY